MTHKKHNRDCTNLFRISPKTIETDISYVLAHSKELESKCSGTQDIPMEDLTPEPFYDNPESLFKEALRRYH